MALVGCDHLHPQLRQLRIKRVAVVSPVTDDTFRQPHYESRPEGIEHEGCFMLLTTRNPDGDRKTIAVWPTELPSEEPRESRWAHRADHAKAARPEGMCLDALVLARTA